MGMAGVFTPSGEEPWFPEYKIAVMSLTDSLKSQINYNCVNSNNTISMLYNAYTEKGFLNNFKALDNLHAHSLYSDSGGLQIVTAGKTMTPEIKKEIYQTQAYADYAMCFDEIPLISTSKTRTRNERSNVKNKIFVSDRMQESALATGRNIKEQVEYFRSIGSNTKVIIIVQGNTAQHMVDWYKDIESLLTEEDYKNIGGLAIADTCMGNGQRESIEMLIAAKKISEFCHENVKHHLHVLGVGSISRMRPILYLIKGGYLSSYNLISYDSSSHTSTFDYGLLKLNGTCKSIGSTKTNSVDIHFRNVYNLFSDTLSKYVTEDQYIDSIFGDGSGDWKYSTVKERGIKTNDPNYIIPNLLAKVAHTYYQIHNFTLNLDKLMGDELMIGKGPINSLLGVKNDAGMDGWIKNNHSMIKSKSISDSMNVINVETFFE